MFVDEARLAARIRHPNVVQTLDVVAEDGELFLVMEYVQGESLARLMKLASERKQKVPHRLAAALISGALQGLHAAHETKDERGQSLGLVHRDVSPQNILVGTDGLARVLDFGVARAAGQVHTSQVGRLKGKIAYMAPEQLENGDVARQADIYSVGVVAWELLTGTRLFRAETQSAVIARVLAGKVSAPSEIVESIPPEYDAVILKALAREPSERYGSALEMALDLETSAGVESPAAVAAWVERIAGDTLSARASRVARVERSSDVSDVSQLRVAVNGLASRSWTRGSMPGAGPDSERPRAQHPLGRSVRSALQAARNNPVVAVTVGVVTVALLGVLIARPWASEAAASATRAESNRTSDSASLATPQPRPSVAPSVAVQEHGDPPSIVSSAQTELTTETIPSATTPQIPSSTPTAVGKRSLAAESPSNKRSATPGKAASPFSGLGGRL
jgi:serine/threonine-protein kinase